MTALLDSLTTGQLSTVYAELNGGGKPTRFNSKTNGRKRVAALLTKTGRDLGEVMRACGMAGAPAEPSASQEPAPKAKRNGAHETLGLVLASLVVAPAGKGLKVYAYGHRARDDGSLGIEARMGIDGQPKGGFANADEAVIWAEERFGSKAAAADWARSQASKGTRLNDPKYAGWTKTIVSEVAF